MGGRYFLTAYPHPLHYKVLKGDDTLDEKQILKYMKNLDLSREEAIQMIKDENEDILTEEQIELEQKAKKNLQRNYVQSEKKRKKSTRERKVDTEKALLLELVRNAIRNTCSNIVVKNEVELSFDYNGNSYTFKLTKHRPPKDKK